MRKWILPEQSDWPQSPPVWKLAQRGKTSPGWSSFPLTSGFWIQLVHQMLKSKSHSLCSLVKIKNIHFIVDTEIRSVLKMWHVLFQPLFSTWSRSRPYLLAILWNSTFKWVYPSFSPLLFASLLFTAICKASSDNNFVFLHFVFLGMVLIHVSCTISWTSVHSSSGTLSDLVP